ncbi:hypothetical protein ScPMuIL_014700 [Solemya velum]
MDELEFPPVPNNVEFTEDWVYTMRREMQEIVPGLYLGPYAAAMKCKFNILKGFGITHIVCVRQNVEAHFVRPNFPAFFRYLVLDVADSVTENIIQFFPKVRIFLEECLISGGRVLVHGNAGISRSAALVIGFLMETYGLSYKDAFLYVQQRRFCINPNEGFARQLMEYEPIYRAKLSMTSGLMPLNTGLLKRKCPDEADDETERMADDS